MTRSWEFELDKTVDPKSLVGNVVDRSLRIILFQRLDLDREIAFQRITADLARFPAIGGVLACPLKTQTLDRSDVVIALFLYIRLGLVIMHHLALCTFLHPAFA